MGTKRKSSVVVDTSERSSKKHKKNKPKSAESRLKKIQKLSAELLDDPELLQDCLRKAGPDVTQAATKLLKAFVPWEDTLRPIPIPTDSQTSTLQTLPELPLIKDKTLEKATFTHQGIVGEDHVPGREVSYERLELLGDAYIEIMATRLIWKRFPALPAGRLSQARETLVKNETLAQFAIDYGFDKRAIVPADYPNQERRWLKTKGDIFEAYVAAIILSDPLSGYERVEKWLWQLWQPKLEEIEAERPGVMDKERLARKIMGKGIKIRYVDEKPMLQRGGLKTFYIGVYLTGWGWTDQHLGSGTGLNRVEAGNQAARQALANKQLIGEISAVKVAFYAKVKAEQAKNE
ncbi:hypothetical protein AJ80_07319 [Polytolypa hystricis UAMH7299]|uniref:RNase III domain-containing protein n=1 Tax=Polytolypa hystricis (strain UAMH7299) TaxID=1447883 RepID=A0A2B7XQP1_POLH7|nr:hypothetical protein AJ80_07319 [Polytolypa hystricis UAMH7299]